MSASLLRVPSVLLLLDMSKELVEAVSIVLWFVLYQQIYILKCNSFVGIFCMVPMDNKNIWLFLRISDYDTLCHT